MGSCCCLIPCSLSLHLAVAGLVGHGVHHPLTVTGEGEVGTHYGCAIYFCSQTWSRYSLVWELRGHQLPAVTSVQCSAASG